MATICGHERDVLIEALDYAEFDPFDSAHLARWQGPCDEDDVCFGQWKSTQAIHDPAKLAVLIAEVGMSLGLSIQLRVLVGDGEWPDFEILYFPNEYAPTVQPKLGFYERVVGKNWDVTMEQARSILLQWLRLSGEARVDALQVLHDSRGDSAKLTSAISVHEVRS